MARPTCCWIAVLRWRLTNGSAQDTGFTIPEIKLPTHCEDHPA